MRLVRLQIQAGFTLIELVIASMALAVMIVSVLTTFNNVENNNLQARNIVIATQVAQQQMEVYRNMTYASIPIGSNQDVSSILSPYPQLKTPRSATVNVTETVAGYLKQVDIDIKYTERGRTRHVQESTLISARGINR